MNNLYSSPKKVYTHYIIYCSTSTGSGEEIWNLQSFGPSPGPPWWQHVHVPYEHLWIPGPWGWFLPSLVKIRPCISSRSRWTVTFYIGPPPQPVTPHGAIGATLGSATNNLYSSPKKVSTLYTTWLFYLNWIWRRSLKFAKFWPLGALPPGPHGGNMYMYHMITFESPAPKDDSCHVCMVKIQTAMNNFYSSPKKVSTLYTTWLFYLNWIWRSLKFAKFWPLGALPPGPLGGNMYICTIWSPLNPQPLRMIPAMSG